MNILISYNWLKEYSKLKASPRDFARRISLSGPSVERINQPAESLDKVVVGRILKVSPHPNADRLRVVDADIGGGAKRIVCGGSNLKEGMLVAVALPGALVRWHGEGEPVEIKVTALRGVESYGMISAANELALFDLYPHEEKEIMDLTATGAKPGTPLAEALGLDDAVFDVEVTSNRPDAFCLVGMAREASAVFGTPFVWKPAAAPAKPAASAALPLKVAVRSKKLCPRYQALAMKNAKVGPSPEWLKRRLVSAGIRPINNLVDITNYVMLELGQPMHVFDYRKLKGQAIVVREAAGGEKMKALDGNDYALAPGQMVIADAERPVAVAGVMGGEETGVTGATTDIVFESANFDPVTVRRTARVLNLHSDSSLRFEKGLSVQATAPALARAAELARELAGAEVASEVFDVQAAPYKKCSYPFRPSRAAELIGVAIPNAVMKKNLTALGFKVTGAGAKWRVEVPHWRDHDIEGERDLVEEVARVYGYGNLPSVIPDGELPLAATDPVLTWEDRAKLTLKDWGLTELISYSLVSKALLEKAGLDAKAALRLLNPLTEDLECLRTSLLPGVLQAVAENQEEDAAGQVFELSNIYLPKPGDLPDEKPRLVVASWGRGDKGEDVKSVKGLVEALAKSMGARLEFARLEDKNGLWHPGRLVKVKIGAEEVGVLGELHPEALARFKIDRRAAAADLDFAALAAHADTGKHYVPAPEFPTAKRDLAFTVDRAVEHAGIRGKLCASGPLVRRADLFDVFEDAKLGAGRKSMAYHLEFGAPDRTLTAEEVDRAMDGIRAMLKKEFGAEAR